MDASCPPIVPLPGHLAEPWVDAVRISLLRNLKFAPRQKVPLQTRQDLDTDHTSSQGWVIHTLARSDVGDYSTRAIRIYTQQSFRISWFTVAADWSSIGCGP